MQASPCVYLLRKLFLQICLLAIFFPYLTIAQVSVIDSLQLLLIHTKEDTSRVNLLVAIANELQRKENYEGAAKYGLESKELSEKLNYKTGVANSYNVLGLSYYNRGSYSEASKNYLQSLKIREEMGDKQGVADCYNNVGLVYLDQGNYPEALKCYLAALKTYETLPAINSSKRRIASAYINIGNINLYQSNYAEALRNYMPALKLTEEIGDKKGMADAYSNIGAIYYLQHSYDDALKNYLRSVDLKKAIDDKQGIADSYINIGLINHDQGKDDEALKNYFLALEIFRKSGNQDGVAASYICIGNAYTGQRKFSDAKKYLLLGLVLAKETGGMDNLKDVYNGLSRLYEASGDAQSAYRYFKMYAEIKDSLLNTDNNRQIAEMRVKYETEKKDNEIALLNSENKLKEAEVKKQKIIKYAGFIFSALVVLLAILIFKNIRIKNKAEQALQRNEIRKRIALDLHDEIGAGLTSITMICEQGKIKTRNKQDDAFNIYQRISNQSQRVSEKLSEVVWATNPDNDNLGSVVAYMRNYVSKFLEDSPISYSMDFPDKVPSYSLEPEVGRNLFFVLKEALNNCIKHSHATHIDIALRLDNKSYRLHIKDNGRGIDYAAIPPYHNGLVNMKKRIEAIKGRFEIASEMGKGTRIEISGNLL